MDVLLVYISMTLGLPEQMKEDGYVPHQQQKIYGK